MPFQDAPSPPMTPELAEQCARAVHVVKANGDIIRAGQATLFLLEHCGYARTARVMRARPFNWLVEPGYNLVAKNRRFFSRFMFRRQGSKRKAQLG